MWPSSSRNCSSAVRAWLTCSACSIRCAASHVRSHSGFLGRQCPSARDCSSKSCRSVVNCSWNFCRASRWPASSASNSASLGLAFGQFLRLALDRLVLKNNRPRLGFGLVQGCLAFLEPEPGRAGVSIQFRRPGVKLRLAMVKFLLPAAEVLGKLRRLNSRLSTIGTHLRRQKFPAHFRSGAGREGGPVFQHLLHTMPPSRQIDSPAREAPETLPAAGWASFMRVSATSSVTEGALLPRNLSSDGLTMARLIGLEEKERKSPRNRHLLLRLV